MHRCEKVLEVLRPEVRQITNQVLAGSISCYFSQAEWEIMAETITNELAARLGQSCAFQEAIQGGDLHDHKGRVNQAGILEALTELHGTLSQPGAAARMKHLIDHVGVIFSTL